ncbi:MAG: phosphoribosylformylglycinamidine cyclo-ligase [Candidatus Odinarchaeia archaeon]
MNSNLTYSSAGVDIDKAKEAHKRIGKLISSTFLLRKGKFGELLNEYGHYAALLDIGDNKALALHADGVGTKVLIAQILDKYDTVGIDCIAMNVNDLICCGAEPVAIVDYIALEKPNPNLVEELVKGLVAGAKQCDVAIVGGETAIMPDVIIGVKDGFGFDLSALSVGVVNKNEIILGDSIKAGDIVVGLRSSGIHSNGYSLVRKIIKNANIDLYEKMPGSNKTIGETLLEPTKIYVKPILELVKNKIVSGLANITGGSFTKLKRITNNTLGFSLKLPKPLDIFLKLKEWGNIETKEMYKTFNMGIGFCVVSPPENEAEIKKILRSHNIDSQVIGTVTKAKEVKITTFEDEHLVY